MKNKNFWIAAGRRALWTICETILGAIGTATLVEQVNWQFVVSASAMAGFISIIKSIITGLPEVED